MLQREDNHGNVTTKSTPMLQQAMKTTNDEQVNE
jgi:hypothetical protein